MGGGAEKLRVLIPTTAGPAEVLLLTEEDSVIGRSVACIGGTTDIADIAAGYHAFVARPTGIVESLFGHSCYRLDVSARIDAGTSWQLGVLAAHALLSAGRLAQENDSANGLIWATGSVRAVDLTVGGVSHIPEKIASSLARLKQEVLAGRRVLVAIPAQNAGQLSADVRSDFAACGIEVLELKHVQSLWDKLDIELPEGARRIAGAAAPSERATAAASPRKRPAWLAAAAAVLVIAAAATYLLVRSPVPVLERQADAMPSPAPSVSAPSPPARSDNMAPTPAPAGPALVPEQVPFISAAEQAVIRNGYLPAADHKALALSFNHAFFASAQPDDRTAAAAAIGGCQILNNADGADPRNCELYASGNVVVSTRGAPPMPRQPWFVHDPSVERPFVAAEVPMAPEHTYDRYVGRPNSKALAMSPSVFGAVFWGEPNDEQASRRVLERCGAGAGVACTVIALDDAFVVPIPKSAKIAGFYRADSLSAVLPELRDDVVRLLAKASGGWSVLAIGASGHVGIRLSAPSEQVAVDGAMLACGKQDRDCRVAVIGPFLVERRQ